tara:strand:- start:129 stop:647 length:519 start_codon:yes stop_codon:yes gene_type:complete
MEQNKVLQETFGEVENEYGSRLFPYSKDKKEKYNGWANYETWNVSLWLQNDWPLYQVTKSYYGYKQPYQALRMGLRETFGYEETQDHVSLWDKALDIEELDEMIMEMQEPDEIVYTVSSTEYETPEEYASRHTGMTYDFVAKLCREKKIQCIKVGNRYWIPKHADEAFVHGS